MRKRKYFDDYDGYSSEEYNALENWIRDHIEKAKRIKITRGLPDQPLDTLISGSDIEMLASEDLGIAFDYEIVRFAMIDIDPFPVKIAGSPIYYYRAMWKDISDPNISDKWRVE